MEADVRPYHHSKLGPGCLKDRVRVNTFFLFQISLFKFRTLIPGVCNSERKPKQSRPEKQFRASTEGDRKEEKGPFEHAVSLFFFSSLPPSLTAAVVPKTQKLSRLPDGRSRQTRGHQPPSRPLEPVPGPISGF